MAKKKSPKSIEDLTHEEASRTNIPSAEHEPIMSEKQQEAIRVA